jgi:heme exporter protein D
VRRSCLVMLVLVAAVLLVVSVSLRRCFLADSASQTTTQARHEAQATQPEVVSRATLDEALVSVAKESGNGTEGLALDTLRPLSTEHITVSGLAVSEDRVYATGCDASGQCGQILVTDVKALTPQARTSVAHDGFPRAGGVLVSGDALWVWLLADGADDATMVVVLDRETLSERSRLALKGAARALVRDPEGMIYGASADGRLLFRWEPDGVLVARHVSATGANYSDCELISGSLVCSGVREDGGAGCVGHRAVQPSGSTRVRGGHRGRRQSGGRRLGVLAGSLLLCPRWRRDAHTVVLQPGWWLAGAVHPLRATITLDVTAAARQARVASRGPYQTPAS